MSFAILVGFAVWLTPHNLPLSGEEQQRIGGQFYPMLKWLGLMPAKNAVINLIILATFVSYLLYRRSNRTGPAPFARQGVLGKGGSPWPVSPPPVWSPTTACRSSRSIRRSST